MHKTYTFTVKVLQHPARQATGGSHGAPKTLAPLDGAEGAIVPAGSGAGSVV